MASSESQIDKPQRGRPKRAELLGVNINTGAAQSINSESTSLKLVNVYSRRTNARNASHNSLSMALNAPLSTPVNKVQFHLYADGGQRQFLHGLLFDSISVDQTNESHHMNGISNSSSFTTVDQTHVRLQTLKNK